MKSKKTLLIIVLLFVLLLGGAYVIYTSLEQKFTPDQLAQQTQLPDKTTDSGEEQEKLPAPDFTALDIDGNEVNLSDYIGKPIVLNFWASWCGPCKMEMPDFHEKYLELGEDVQFLMINVTTGRETLESAYAFIEEQEYTFPVLYDTEMSAAMAYSAYSLPTTYLIDADGYVVAKATGAIDAETLQMGIDMILPQE